MPVIVAIPLANQVGTKIPVASSDPAAARSPMTPEGRTASPAVLMARNNTIAFVAVPFSPLSLSSSSIALMPKGVAALPRPSMLLAMFMIIALIAGCSGGTVGNRRRMTGATARATSRSRPPSSATFISPRKNAITPISLREMSTALRESWRIALVSACISPFAAASRIESKTRNTKMPLSMSPPRRHLNPDYARGFG
jgi:hypothetical protein